jgi:hypothetical protein
MVHEIHNVRQYQHIHNLEQAKRNPKYVEPGSDIPGAFTAGFATKTDALAKGYAKRYSATTGEPVFEYPFNVTRTQDMVGNWSRMMGLKSYEVGPSYSGDPVFDEILNKYHREALSNVRASSLRFKYDERGHRPDAMTMEDIIFNTKMTPEEKVRSVKFLGQEISKYALNKALNEAQKGDIPIPAQFESTIAAAAREEGFKRLFRVKPIKRGLARDTMQESREGKEEIPMYQRLNAGVPRRYLPRPPRNRSVMFPAPPG